MHLYIFKLYKLIHDGINRKTGYRMYFQLTGYITPMGNDCMYGQEKLFGNLFVGHTLHYTT